MTGEPRFNADGSKIWKSSTDHVFRNLQGEVLHSGGGLRADHTWELFPLDSLEHFQDEAISWLGEHSELSSSTLRHADWDAVYAYCKEMSEE